MLLQNCSFSQKPWLSVKIGASGQHQMFAYNSMLCTPKSATSLVYTATKLRFSGAEIKYSSLQKTNCRLATIQTVNSFIFLVSSNKKIFTENLFADFWENYKNATVICFEILINFI